MYKFYIYILESEKNIFRRIFKFILATSNIFEKKKYFQVYPYIKS